MMSKKLAIAAIGLLAGGAFGNFLLDDLERGTGQHYLDNYWYYDVNDDKGLMANEVEGNYRRFIINAGPSTQYERMSFRPDSGTARGQFAAAMVFEDLNYASVAVNEELNGSVSMGMLLSNDENVGVGENFEILTGIEFWMKTEDVDTVTFKVYTVKNSASGQTPYGPVTWGDDGRIDLDPSNAYMVKIAPATDEWAKYTVNIGGTVTPSTMDGQRITSASTGGGRVGDLTQEGWYGVAFTFARNEITKIAWQVDDNKNSSKSGAIYVDDIKLLAWPTNVVFRPAVPSRSAARVTVRNRTLHVSGSSSGSVSRIRLIDMRGKSVANFNVGTHVQQRPTGARTPGRPLSFALTNIPAGRYFVEVRDGVGRVERGSVVVGGR